VNSALIFLISSTAYAPRSPVATKTAATFKTPNV
jgi:hypothetical protein